MEDRKRQGVPEGQGAGQASGELKLGPLAPGQRWTVARKREAVLRLLRGESVDMLSRELASDIVTATSTTGTVPRPVGAFLCHRRDMDVWNLPGGGVESGELPTGRG